MSVIIEHLKYAAKVYGDPNFDPAQFTLDQIIYYVEMRVALGEVSVPLEVSEMNNMIAKRGLIKFDGETFKATKEIKQIYKKEILSERYDYSN